MKIKLNLSPFSNNHVSRTFFRSALITAALLLLVLGGVKLLSPFPSSAKQNIQNSGRPQSIPSKSKSCLACSDRADRFIYAPLLDLPEAQGSELVFNSRSTQEIDITPTFYKLDGTAIVGKPVRVKPSEIRYVDLKKLIPRQYRNDRDWGGITLAYTGGTREIWSQLRLLRVNGGGSVDEFFTVPQESRADMQEAVWWAPPQSSAIIALGNITNTATSATVLFGDGKAQIVNLAPHATEVIRYTPNSLEGGQSVAINITGAAGSIVPTGVIASTDGSFNSVIRFYNTKTGKQPHLFANGLRLAGVIPHMILKNTSSEPITATPEFIPSGDRSAGNPLTLPAITISPRQTVEVDLGPLMSAAKIRNDLNMVSAKVYNSGAPGSLIGAIYSNDYATGVNYDVPLRDSGPLRNATGSYPWRLDDDYSTVVSITNIGSQSADFITAIRYEGGVYSPQQRTLAVGETAVFDLKKIRDEQIPDKVGNPLLRKAAVGQFHWSVLRGGDNVRLIGRAEMVSASKKVSSSYSCPVCCPDSGPYGSYNPNPLTLVVDGFLSTTAQGEYIDCNGRVSYTGASMGLHNWFVMNGAVISAEYANGDTNTIHGLSGGLSFFGALHFFMSYDNDGMDCYPRPLEDAVCMGEATVLPQVTIASNLIGVPKNDTAEVDVTLSPSPSDIPVTLRLSTTSGTGEARFSSNNSTTLVISQTTTVSIKGITESETANNIRLVAVAGSPETQLASRTFSVVWVTLALRVSGDIPNDNGAKSTYNTEQGRNTLGTFFTTGTDSGLAVTGVEIVGTVKPTNYSGLLKLVRTLEGLNFNNQTAIESSRVPAGTDDTSRDRYRDDDPQSGNSQGKIYDLDAPGFAFTAPPGAIARKRGNFIEYATMQVRRGGELVQARCSSDLLWFTCISIRKTETDTVFHTQPEIMNDNRAGAGTIKLTWDLK